MVLQNAYKTLMDIGGLETEAEYGYDGEDEACKFNRSKVSFFIFLLFCKINQSNVFCLFFCKFYSLIVAFFLFFSLSQFQPVEGCGQGQRRRGDL